MNLGKPEVFHCDNGSEFIAKVVKKTIALLEVEERHGLPYNPSTCYRILTP